MDGGRENVVMDVLGWWMHLLAKCLSCAIATCAARRDHAV